MHETALKKKRKRAKATTLPKPHTLPISYVMEVVRYFHQEYNKAIGFNQVGRIYSTVFNSTDSTDTYNSNGQ